MLPLFVVTSAFGRQQALPIPPIPPAVPPLMDAPVPDLDIRGPFDDASKPAVTLDLGIDHRVSPSMGFGFSPGARYQLDNDRRFFVLPGILVRMPLP
jgi:hypothetical protein